MRKLIYIPVIHTEADLGSLATQLYHKKIPHSAEKKRVNHVQTVLAYWTAIETFFETFDLPADGVKIFQDGMFADGDLAVAILKEGIKSGSRNSKIVQKLIDRGATLIKTEDYRLVKAEYDQIQRIVKAPNLFWQYFQLLKYKLQKQAFLKKRDRFIAATIDECLHSDQLGILFIGASHHIIQNLPGDIEVTQLKEIKKVREYLQAVRSQRNRLTCKKLSHYLTTPCHLPSWPKTE